MPGRAYLPPCRSASLRVYSFDGPGMDEETLGSQGYERISARIESYIPQSSVVGMLLHYHPRYTVVRSTSLGILQHDAMTWQVENGDFVRLDGLDMSGKITDEAIHTWLQGMDMDQRRELVDTLYRVVDASHAELVTDLIEDWRDSAVKALEAIRGLDPQAKGNVRRMLRSLFSSGAGGGGARGYDASGGRGKSRQGEGGGAGRGEADAARPGGAGSARRCGCPDAQRSRRRRMSRGGDFHTPAPHADIRLRKARVSGFFSLKSLTFALWTWYYDTVVRNMRFSHALLAR